LIKRTGCRFDMVHGQSPYPSALAARIISRHFKVLFVVNLRDDLSHLASLYESRGSKKYFDPMFASLSAIFVHGPVLFRDVPKFLPRGAHPNIVLALNGVDFEGIEKTLTSLDPTPSHAWG